MIRTYIETLLEMPWDKMCEEHKISPMPARYWKRITMDWKKVKSGSWNFWLCVR